MTTEEFIQKAKAVHGDKYDYSKVEYVNAKTKVCVICPKHGEFYIGCYQLAQKWLKDCRGRTLTYDDIQQYRKIISVLIETKVIMDKIG